MSEIEKTTRTMYGLGLWLGGALLVYGVILKVFHFNPSGLLMHCLKWKLFGF